MTRTRIKFCGIVRAADADAAVAAGADAVGLVHVPGSSRFIDIEAAAMIRARLPAFVQAVGLFRNPQADQVRAFLGQVHPDLLQFHGEEEAAFCSAFGVPYIKAVPMKNGEAEDLAQWSQRFATAAALLLDAHAPGEMGGQGRPFSWSGVDARTAGRPIVLAGGLTPGNVGGAIRQVRPFAVDVSSGIESAPGVKDLARMQEFVKEVQRADAG